MQTQDQRRKVGQLFVVGFHGHHVDANITTLIRDYGIGTVILFRRNIASAKQLQALCLNLQRVARDAQHTHPLFIAIDQENGLVTRISPPIAPQQPGAMAIAAAAAERNGSIADRSSRVAAATGEMLSFFGINVNYAPVGDVNSEPLNPVIGVRSAGDDPSSAAEFATGCIRGLRDHRVVPCIKHFPGHGDTSVDSHHGLPVVDKSRRQLDQVELVPFRRAAVDERVEMVMTAHIALPQLTGSNLPATLSADAMAILRDEWNYQGVVVTDCMEMDGVRATYGTVEGTLMALKAGVDSVMICHTFEAQTAAIDRICQAVESGDLSPERIEASLSRLCALKERYTSWETALRAEMLESLDAINEKAARVADEIYADAITVVRKRSETLPLDPFARVVVVSPSPDAFALSGAADSDALIGELFASAIERHASPPLHVQFRDELTAEQWQHVEAGEVVVLATQNAQASQRAIGLEIARRRGALPTVCIATCSPYDFLDDADEMGTYMTIYEPTREAVNRAVDVLYGAPARGKLPVKQQT
ncbi:Beta-hexosaminidase [Escovopsis weberi]|uniref:Beta-hexosaminidase n=1 Tax=Escovopsis weberi TaxID=150374 RepID=A0A0M8MX86_ESCWE|nr:Beta-hexosaminidase [Escovopsis weberi]